MNTARGAGARDAKASDPGPWHYATLAMPCKRCDAAPGDRCCWADGSIRGKFHYERYELARECAGIPLRGRRNLGRPEA
jgi:hypothetical protein